MGLAIGMVFLIVLKFLFDSFRYRINTTKAMQWSIRMGLLSVVIACIGGGIMSGLIKHSVGILDGGVDVLE